MILFAAQNRKPLRHFFPSFSFQLEKHLVSPGPHQLAVVEREFLVHDPPGKMAAFALVMQDGKHDRVEPTLRIHALEAWITLPATEKHQRP